jgi:hypothetical protein
MKKTFVFALVLINMLFAQNRYAHNGKSDLESWLRTTGTRNIQIITITDTKKYGTYIRSSSYGESFEVNNQLGTSMWLVDTARGTGWFIDITPNITSYYKLEHVKWIREIDNKSTSGNSTNLMITGKATSDPGARYHFIINDDYNTVMLTGQDLSFVLFRQYKAGDLSTNTASAFLNEWNEVFK